VQILCALRQRAEVQVFCPIPAYPRGLRSRSFSEADPDYQVPPLTVTYIRYPSLPVLSRPFNGATCARYLEPHLRAYAPDVVLNYWIYPQGRGALLAARRLGAAVVVGAIGSDLNALPDPVSAHLARRTMLEADHVITKSAKLRELALTMGVPAAQVTAIPNGCDHGLFAPGDRAQARRALGVAPEARLIVFVGRLEMAKGIRELAEACRRLRAGEPNLQLAYVGDGLGAAWLKRYQADNPGWMLLPSSTDAAGVARWLRASDVLALPSYAEGCPNVVLEALSCGRPVVASAVGGIPEIVNDECGVLVPPQNVPALRDALAQVLGRPWDEALLASVHGRAWSDVAGEVYAILAASMAGRAETVEALA
jgi:glycosyltransferase involved in cell wall biosynthesis